MTVESFHWVVMPGCGVAALLLMYDVHRAIRPRIAGEQPWRESRVMGVATFILGIFMLQSIHGPGWVDGAIQVLLVLSLVPLLWSSVSLTRLIGQFLRQAHED